MTSEVEGLAEVVGARDCELMRAIVGLSFADKENPNIQIIRRELAKTACQDCRVLYLLDVVSTQVLD